jgi:hypothetical protein
MTNIPSQYQILPGFRTYYDESELRIALAFVELLSFAGITGSGSGSGTISQIVPKSAPITTDGTTGDKTIITSSNAGKQIYLSSLYFMGTSQALITLKSGSTALSGQMNITSMASDFPKPLILGVNQNFIINIATVIPINGFAIYWEA